MHYYKKITLYRKDDRAMRPILWVPCRRTDRRTIYCGITSR